MEKLLAQARVIATSVVTYAVAAGFLITTVAAEFVPHLADGQAEAVTRWATLAVTWLGVLVSIIRRVTPVPDADVGVLPPG